MPFRYLLPEHRDVLDRVAVLAHQTIDECDAILERFERRWVGLEIRAECRDVACRLAERGGRLDEAFAERSHLRVDPRCAIERRDGSLEMRLGTVVAECAQCSIDVAHQGIRVAKADDLLSEVAVGLRVDGRVVDLGDLEGQGVALALEGAQIAADLVGFAEYVPVGSPRFRVAFCSPEAFLVEEAIDERADAGRGRDRELVVLADDGYGARQCLGECPCRRCGSVDVGPRARGIDGTADGGLGVALDESARNVARRRCRSDDALSSLVAAQEAKRSEHEGLAGSRLTGDDGEAFGEPHVRLSDEPEVVDDDLIKHGRARTARGRPGGRGDGRG